jgi:hypothetical protein
VAMTAIVSASQDTRASGHRRNSRELQVKEPIRDAGSSRDGEETSAGRP